VHTAQRRGLPGRRRRHANLGVDERCGTSPTKRHNVALNPTAFFHGAPFTKVVFLLFFSFLYFFFNFSIMFYYIIYLYFKICFDMLYFFI